MSHPGFARALGVVVLAAFLIRLGAAAVFQGLDSPPDPGANPDQVYFENAAQQLAAGNGYALREGEPTYLRPPGTSAALAMVYALAGRSRLAGRVWFCLLSAATCAVLGWTARRFFGARTGLAAAAMLALTPAHWYYAQHFVSEVPYALLVTAAAALAWEVVTQETGRRRIVHGAAAGLLFAAAAMVRPQAGLVVPVAWIVWLLAPGAARRRVLPGVVVATLMFAGATGAWVARNARVLDRPTFAALGGPTFWGAHNERVLGDPALCGSWTSVRALPPLSSAGLEFPRDEARLAEISWRQGLGFVRSHWRDMPRLEACKLRRLMAVVLDTPNRPARWAFAAAWLLTAPLAVIGLAAAWKEERAAALAGLLPLLALLAAALIFYGSIRFRHSSEPLLVLFAARGLTALVASRPPTPWRRPRPPGDSPRRRETGV
jgi:4-amino-4-deoxy-L-arabinose transferase-like glycosyltransferase